VTSDIQSEAVVGESWFVRVATLVIGLLLGIVLGMLGTVVSQSTVSFFGLFPLPYGLVMAIAASFFMLLGLRLILPTRTVALLAAVGLVGIVAVLTLPSRGGSILIPATVQGYVWTFAPTVVSLVVLAWPRLGARPAAAAA
jgi:hypothetical protein